MGRRIRTGRQDDKTWVPKKLGQRPLLRVDREPRTTGQRVRVFKSKKPNLGCVGYVHARGYIDQKWRRS